MTVAKESTTSLSASVIVTIVGLLVAVTLGAIVALIITRIINRPIIATAVVAQKISEDDLMAKLEVKSSDEIGQMAEAMNRMVENLRNVVSDVTKAAVNVSQCSFVSRSICRRLTPSTNTRLRISLQSSILRYMLHG